LGLTKIILKDTYCCNGRLTSRLFFPGGYVVWGCVCVVHSQTTPGSPLLGQPPHMGLGHMGESGPYCSTPPSRWVVDIYHPHLVTCQVTVLCSLSLCQAICKLLPRADMSKADDPNIKFLLDEEAINFHMFCLLSC
jgi:hypothetical protein